MSISVADIVADIELGQFAQNTWRKAPTQTTGSGIWFDLSLSPGNPVPQYFAASPMVATALARSADVGLNYGPLIVSPSPRYLLRLSALTVTATAVPLPMILMDYLRYVPFVDMSITDPAPVTNNIALPRYPTGEGVKMMAVVRNKNSTVGRPPCAAITTKFRIG